MITLPHSGLTVPHTELCVVSLRKVRHPYGLAIAGVLRLGQRMVGLAEDDGLGGPTTFHGPGDYFNLRDMDAFAAQCRHGGEVLHVGKVLDYLIDEYDFGLRAVRAAQKRRTLARTAKLERYPEA
jgi:hypothetical protein